MLFLSSGLLTFAFFSLSALTCLLLPGIELISQEGLEWVERSGGTVVIPGDRGRPWVGGVALALAGVALWDFERIGLVGGMAASLMA